MDKNKPARNLLGATLNNGWKVIEKLTEDVPNGGTFSVNYLAQSNNKIGFLKALDYSVALESDDPPATFILLSKEYEFELELWKICNDKQLSRIVRILDQGVIKPSQDSIIPVPYFILEYSANDVKSQVRLDSYLNAAWLFKILHNVSIGLYQLHNNGIAANELKPDTIIGFGSEIYKLSGLSKASKKITGSDLNGQPIILDPNSIAIEKLYGFSDPDWIYGSQASDAYNLGSLTLFLFTQVNMTSCMTFFIEEDFHWTKWNRSFKELLPYLYVAFEKSLFYIYTYIQHEEVRDEVIQMLKELCDPDPYKRGHPRDIKSVGSSLSLYRYITKFDRWQKLSLQKLNS